MANSIKTNTTTDKYIKTFDACDDPIVYTLVRVSPYTMEDMLLGVFDSKEAVPVSYTHLTLPTKA